MISLQEEATSPDVKPGDQELSLRGSPSERDRGMSAVASTLLLPNTGLAVLALWGWLQFGSISSAIGFLRGDQLIPDSYSKSFGNDVIGSSKAVIFRLSNHGNKPIRILGARTTCTCTIAQRGQEP